MATATGIFLVKNEDEGEDGEQIGVWASFRAGRLLEELAEAGPVFGLASGSDFGCNAPAVVES